MDWRHWKKGYGRIFRSAAESVGLPKWGRVIGLLIGQVLVAALLYVVLGATAFSASIGLRLLVASAPFLTFPVMFLWELAQAPAKAERELELATKSAASEGCFPDMTIRELFFHIDDRLTDEDFRWKAVRAEVMDALSLGRIRCWGRLRIAGAGRFGLSGPPLREISASTWLVGQFTMFFLEEGHEKVIHFEGIDANHCRVQYSDLQVNASQARAVWPR
jgi:hypothetical protein